MILPLIASSTSEPLAFALLQATSVTIESANPEKLPEEYRKICDSEGKVRAVTDYIAGMSDRYLLAIYKNIFIPDSWVDIGLEEG